VALHRGEPVGDGDVALVAADPDELRAAPMAADVALSVERWLAAAAHDPGVYYFAVRRGADLVGQILLHDADWSAGEALVAYHVLRPELRGRGVGSRALALLQRWVRAHTDLRRLLVITSADNAASRRTAEKCGFVPIGAPREDPNGVVLAWPIPRTEGE
jgi:RimJ/RimL family protein N-acetyltransferase